MMILKSVWRELDSRAEGSVPILIENKIHIAFMPPHTRFDAILSYEEQQQPRLRTGTSAQQSAVASHTRPYPEPKLQDYKVINILN